MIESVPYSHSLTLPSLKREGESLGAALGVEIPEVEAVRGTWDVLPPRKATEQAIEDRLQEVFARYGYEPIETPVLEPTELFLRKAGEAIAALMYSFSHWNRDLCLRPEFTASVIRAYVNHMQDRPLPVRVQYAGPTFQSEKPQQGRHRQYTQVGAECIGAAGPAADGEVLALAREGLEAVGVQRARFVVGHLGAVLDLLAQMGMDARGQSLIVSEMERLAQGPLDSADLVGRLATMLTGEVEGQESQEGALVELLRSVGADAAAEITTRLFERAQLSLDGGSRRPEEIVERLLKKSRRPNPTPNLQRASEFICRLRELAGPPQDALPALRRFLADQGLNDQPVLEVQRALECFNAYFTTETPMSVDLSFARGLRYYTGLVFEVYDDQGGYLAGGGRYDDLVRALGGRNAIPACGFSYGLEQVVAAAERESGPRVAPPAVQVLVTPVEEPDYVTAARAAALLRREGLAVEVDVRYRGLKGNLRYADRQRIPLVLIVGERERVSGALTLRDMRSFAELAVRLGPELAQVVRQRLGAEG